MTPSTIRFRSALPSCADEGQSLAAQPGSLIFLHLPSMVRAASFETAAGGAICYGLKSSAAPAAARSRDIFVASAAQDEDFTIVRCPMRQGQIASPP
jgi:hypothetical protein